MSKFVKKNLVIGRVSNHYGIKGWVKIFSYSDPINNIINYKDWFFLINDKLVKYQIIEGKEQNKKIIVKIKNIENREDAEHLIGKDIYIDRASLQVLGNDQFYWNDLEGLEVYTDNDSYLGKVKCLFATGSNDVIVVDGKSEYLIPYLFGDTVIDVNLKKGLITVNWDVDY
ncbi:MAG: hypothetical protein CBC38_06865 [Gammaproteobacteria bacterium TMED78]|nr:MAG: hypothetical protein CBC38_06865 [Gammaproteobacteria bacterium TMED78]|tara:strand:- start:26522 stop:27034 length:513 start_codon:yes stop_codon:yes gene_type:complete